MAVDRMTIKNKHADIPKSQSLVANLPIDVLTPLGKLLWFHATCDAQIRAGRTRKGFVAPAIAV